MIRLIIPQGHEVLDRHRPLLSIEQTQYLSAGFAQALLAGACFLPYCHHLDYGKVPSLADQHEPSQRPQEQCLIVSDNGPIRENILPPT